MALFKVAENGKEKLPYKQDTICSPKQIYVPFTADLPNIYLENYLKYG